ncbi:anion permease [Escherichia coli]
MKLLAPLVVMGVMFLIPVPDGMPPQAWHSFAVFVAMIVGIILEPIPATAISFIAVPFALSGSNYLLFDAKELADPAFNAQKQALKWGLAGFSSTTVWLVFGAFIFALGYEVFRVRSSHCPFGEIHGQTHADVGLCDCHYRHSAGTVYTVQHRAYRGYGFSGH